MKMKSSISPLLLLSKIIYLSCSLTFLKLLKIFISLIFVFLLLLIYVSLRMLSLSILWCVFNSRTTLSLSYRGVNFSQALYFVFPLQMHFILPGSKPWVINIWLFLPPSPPNILPSHGKSLQTLMVLHRPLWFLTTLLGKISI